MNEDALPPPISLGEFRHGDRGDAFVQLVSRNEGVTRNGRLYIRLDFRDDRRCVSAMLWEDSPWLEACRHDWKVGGHFKIRAVYTETAHGPQLKLQKIRPVNEEDVAQGFDPVRCQPCSFDDPAELWEAATAFCRHEIKDASIRELTTEILTAHREALLLAPAALHHHHPYQGGLLEHLLSVAQIVLQLILQYRRQYSMLQNQQTCDLAIAGALTHDIGKVQEIDLAGGGVAPTLDGQILGHVLIGRDMVRAACRTADLAADLTRRLELIFLTHQDYYADGDYRRPLSTEALLVQQADRIDSELYRFAAAIATFSDDALIKTDTPFQRAIFRSELTAGDAQKTDE